MVDAPERIWAGQNTQGKRGWTCTEPPRLMFGPSTEYIRADIAERELAEARAATETKEQERAEQWRQRREALASLTTAQAACDTLRQERDDLRITEDKFRMYLRMARASRKKWKDRATAAEAERDHLAAENAGFEAALFQVGAVNDSLVADRARLRSASLAVDAYARSAFPGPDGERSRKAAWRGVIRKVRAELLKGEQTK